MQPSSTAVQVVDAADEEEKKTDVVRQDGDDDGEDDGDGDEDEEGAMRHHGMAHTSSKEIDQSKSNLPIVNPEIDDLKELLERNAARLKLDT